MANDWYYHLFGQELGPVSRDEIIEKLGSGEIGPDDDVRQGADGEWRPAARVSEFSATVAALRRSGSGSTTAVATQKPKAEWYWQTLGTEFGPVSFEELQSIYERGELSFDDSVRRGERGAWQAAGRALALDSTTSFGRAAPASTGNSDIPDIADFDVTPRPETLRSKSRPPADYVPFEDSPTMAPGMPAPTMPRSAPAPAAAIPAPPVMAPPPATAPQDPQLIPDWYCYINQQEYGPLAAEALQAYAAQGTITPEVYVKFGAMGQWVAARDVGWIFAAPAVPPAPAMVPPQAVAPAPAPAAPTAAGSVVQTTLADSERQALAQQLLELLRGEGLATPVTKLTDDHSWFCRVGDAEVGPMSIESLAQMVLQKRLFPDDEIRQGKHGEWFAASTVPELFPKESEAAGKKSKLPEVENVLDRVDRLLRESEAARAKEMQQTLESPSGTNVGGRTEARQPAPQNNVNVARNAIQNMNANIVRQGTAAPTRSAKSSSSSSSSGSGMMGELEDLLKPLNLTPASAGGIVVLLVACYFGYVYLLGPMLTGGSYRTTLDELLGLQVQMKGAMEGDGPTPEQWKPKGAEIEKKTAEIIKRIGKDKSPHARSLRRAADTIGTISSLLATPKDIKRDENIQTLDKSLADTIAQLRKQLGTD